MRKAKSLGCAKDFRWLSEAQYCSACCIQININTCISAVEDAVDVFACCRLATLPASFFFFHFDAKSSYNLFRYSHLDGKTQSGRNCPDVIDLMKSVRYCHILDVEEEKVNLRFTCKHDPNGNRVFSSTVPPALLHLRTYSPVSICTTMYTLQKLYVTCTSACEEILHDFILIIFHSGDT